MRKSLKAMMREAGSNIREIAKVLKMDLYLVGQYVNEYGGPVPPHIRRKIEIFLEKGAGSPAQPPTANEDTGPGTSGPDAEDPAPPSSPSPEDPAAGDSESGQGYEDPEQTNLLLDPEPQPKKRRGRKKNGGK